MRKIDALKIVSLIAVLQVIQSCRTSGPNYDLKESQRKDMPLWRERFGITWNSPNNLGIVALNGVGPACVYGLMISDRVVELLGQRVTSDSEFEAVAQKNIQTAFRPWCFGVVRNGRSIVIPVGCDKRKSIGPYTVRSDDCGPLQMSRCGPLSSYCNQLQLSQ